MFLRASLSLMLLFDAAVATGASLLYHHTTDQTPVRVWSEGELVPLWSNAIWVNVGNARLIFAAPDGQPLVAGNYENARPLGWAPTRYLDPQAPVLHFTIPANIEPYAGTGRFRVLELRRDAFDAVEGFAVDFEQPCVPGPSIPAGCMILGSVRWRAGDATCQGAADGTPCNDADRCSGTSTCVDQHCVADPLPDATCDPGTCRESCDDGNVCTTDGACNLDTGECPRDVVPGRCWVGPVKVFIAATALGRTCTCSAPAGVIPVLGADDGSLAVEGGSGVCNGNAVNYPDLVGTWTATGRRRMRLSATNMGEIVAVAAQCTGFSLQLKKESGSASLSRNDKKLRGTLRNTIRLGGMPVPVTLRFSYGIRGTLTPGGASGNFFPNVARCGRRLSACLRSGR